MASLEDLLEGRLKISKESIGTFDVKELKDFSKSSYEGISLLYSESIDGIINASSKTDNSDAPQTPSYQPQNEALLSISGQTLEKSALGATVNNALGIQEKSLETLEKAGMLSSDFYTSTNFIKDGIKESNKLMSDLAAATANSTEKAHGSILFASHSDFKIAGGGNVYFGSDTSVNINAPIHTSVSKTKTEQASVHITTADTKAENLRDKFEDIERTKHTVAQDNHKVIRGKDRSYAKEKSVVATTNHTVTANKVINNANDIAETNSANAIKTSSKGPTIGQAGSISLISQSSTVDSIAKNNPTKAEGSNKTESDNNNDTEIGADGSITFVAKGQGDGITGLLSSYADNKLDTSKGVSISLSELGTATVSKGVIGSIASANIMAGSVASEVHGGVVAGMSTAAGGNLIILGRRSYLGLPIFQVPTVPDLEMVTLPEIIELFPLPKLPIPPSTSQLENCIPSKFKKNSSTNTDNTDSSIINSINSINSKIKTKPSAEDLGKILKSQVIPTTKDGHEGTSIKEADTIDRIGEGSKTSPPNVGIKDNASIDSAQEEINYRTRAAGYARGGIDIYSEDTIDTNPLSYDQDDFTNAEDAGDDQIEQDKKEILSQITCDLVKEEALKFNAKQTAEIICQKIDNSLFNYLLDIEEKDLKSLKDKKLSEIKIENFNLKEVIEEDFFTYPYVTEILISTINRGVEKSSLSSQGGLGSIFGKVKGAFSGITKGLKIVESVQGSNIFEIIDTAKSLPIIGKEVSAASNFINNNNLLSTVYNIGQQGLGKGLTQQQFWDFAAKEIKNQALNKIEGKVQSQLAKLNIPFSIEDVKEIQQLISSLHNVNNSNLNILEKSVGVGNISQGELSSFFGKSVSITPEKKEEVIFHIAEKLSRVTGVSQRDQLDKAIDIYEQGKEVIDLVKKGKYEEILSGEGASTLLAGVLGEKGVGTIKELQSLYSQGSSIYKQGESLYKSLKSLPSLIKMMKSYDIPLLSQASIALACLDLEKQIGDLFDSLGDLFNNFGDLLDSDSENSQDSTNLPTNINNENNEIDFSEDVIDINVDNIKIANESGVNTETVLELIETTPRLVQVHNTIKETPSQIILNSNFVNPSPSIPTVNLDNSQNSQYYQKEQNNSPIPGSSVINNPILTDSTTSTNVTIREETSANITTEQIINIKKVEVNYEDDCYFVPRLNFLEASIEIKEISQAKIIFTVPNLLLLQNNQKDLYPQRGKMLQIRVSSFRREKDNSILSINRDRKYFTPYVYTFMILDYSYSKNLGLAMLIQTQPKIYLRSDVLLEYDIKDIGGRIHPDIIDSYLLL